MANGYKKYTTYVFHNQDPMISVLNVVRRADKIGNAEIRRRSDGNIASSTMSNWWKGKTKRPQLATIANAALALGLESIPLTSEGRKKIIAKYKNT